VGGWGPALVGGDSPGLRTTWSRGVGSMVPQLVGGDGEGTGSPRLEPWV